MHVQLCLSSCNPTDCNPWEFSGRNTGVGCHFLLPGELPNPGIEPESPDLLHRQADSLPLCHLRVKYFICESESKLKNFKT